MPYKNHVYDNAQKEESCNIAKELFENYSVLIKAFINKTVNNDDIADELTGETYLKVVIYISKFIDLKEDGRLKLLYRIANSVLIDYLRKEKRRQTDLFSSLNSENDEDEIEFEADIKSDIDIEEEYIEKEDCVRMIKVLSQMKEPVKSFLLMHYGEGMKIEDIADIYNMNSSTVRSAIQRGREKLFKIMEEKK